MLSQFTKEAEAHITLADYLDLKSDIYPIGRLDKDSEGLLLLTDDNQLKTRLLDPKSKNTKTYWVQVDGKINDEAIKKLCSGVDIKLKNGKYRTLPCSAKAISPSVPDRNPPVRVRQNIPTSWIAITITEGKNRQVRKMCAAVGFPCLRLIRTAIKGLTFAQIEAGAHRLLTQQEIKQLKDG